MQTIIERQEKGMVHCPICTHEVPAAVSLQKKTPHVWPGQKCPRCGSSLDVAVVVEISIAA
jgi:hypothetical protein